jgi:hypothetical protein
LDVELFAFISHNHGDIHITTSSGLGIGGFILGQQPEDLVITITRA